MKAAAKGFRPMMKNTYVMLGNLSKAFYMKNGKEALPIISEIAAKGGEEQAKIIRKMMPIKDMDDVSELFEMMNSTMEVGMEVIEISDKRIHFKNPKCMLGLEGTSRELCESMMNQDKKMLSILLRKEVEINLAKSLAAGDKECEVIISIK